MALSRLQDDLLQEFKEEKNLIYTQLELFDPLSDSLRKPAAQRLVHKGSLIFLEILNYLIALGGIAVIVFFNKLYPFYLLSQLRIRYDKINFDRYETEALYWVVIGLIGLASILFYFLARAVRRIRLKNSVIQVSAKHMKTLVGQHLNRKAAIDAIEQRHFSELPELEDPYAPQQGVNNVPNPGF
ncbi:hypothetical protein [Taibaiella soli]|uniref:Uncharacterized protein n=1 Tax=Taibaiella soli TaxID=1649169 RepID=A0A2W2C022_9BACT|nr:hypothetical protein [Taibaiella soli]PZF73413.1 hypothetical protein DN068_08460 [Taibaiella soli]